VRESGLRDSERAKLRSEIVSMLIAETGYWNECSNPLLDGITIGAVGALSNVISAFLLELSPEDFQRAISKRKSHDADIPQEPALFYVQHRGFCGDSFMWWKAGRCGYTPNLNQSAKMTLQEFEQIRRPGEDFAWPVDLADRIAERHVNSENPEASEFFTKVRGTW
jgi:hypothetical protein